MQARSRPSSLRSHLLGRTLLVGLAPVLVLAAVAILGSRSLDRTAERAVAASRVATAERTASIELRPEVELTSREIDRLIASTVTAAASLADQPAVVGQAEALASDADALLDGELARSPQLVAIGLTDRTGYFAGWAGGDVAAPQSDQSTRPWWQGAWERGSHVGDVEADPGTGRRVVPVAARIENGAGEWIGVLVATLDVGAIPVRGTGDDGSGIAVTVVAADGQPLTGDAANPAVDAVGKRIAGGAGTLVTADAAYAYAPVAWDTARGQEGVALDLPRWGVVASLASPTAQAPVTEVEALAGEIGAKSSELVLAVLVVLLFGGFVALAIASSLVRQIIGPIKRLTDHGRHASTSGASPGTWFDVEAGIEVGELQELARSFGAAQRSAVHASEQQVAQRETATELFANLGRRSQSLVRRQLRLIDELERSEDDPDRLASLFKLDHLAARMRRNAESLLVVTDQRPQMRRSAPVRIELVVQGALSEIEHFERVSASRLEPIAIAGRAVGDTAHLLAELVENALACSPPDTSVAITGASGHDRYRLSVIDRGIGMSAAELATANERLGAGRGLELASPTQLGLTVVAKLAARHGITVRLEPAEGGGIAARVELPHELLQAAEQASGVPEPATVANPDSPPRPVRTGTTPRPAAAPSARKVMRRQSRRDRAGEPVEAPARGSQRAKRAIATTASTDEVASEATELRQRWSSFQDGRRQAGTNRSDK